MKPPALQAVDGSFQLTHGLFQNAAGTGNIEPHIPVQAPAEGTAVVEAQLCLPDHEVMKRFVAQAQIPAVQPHEVGGIGGVGPDLGDVLFAVVHHEVEVGGNVGQELLQPFLAFIEGHLHGGDGEGVVAVDVQNLSNMAFMWALGHTAVLA